jgi:hypothetical protein
VRRLVDEFRASERRVCGLMEIPRMSYQYRCRRDDSALRERLLALAREKPRFGYRRQWVNVPARKVRELRPAIRFVNLVVESQILAVYVIESGRMYQRMIQVRVKRSPLRLRPAVHLDQAQSAFRLLV